MSKHLDIFDDSDPKNDFAVFGDTVLVLGQLSRATISDLAAQIGKQGLLILFEPDSDKFYELFRQVGDKDFPAKAFPVPLDWQLIDIPEFLSDHCLSVDAILCPEASFSDIRPTLADVCRVFQPRIAVGRSCDLTDIPDYELTRTTSDYYVLTPAKEREVALGTSARFRPYVDFKTKVGEQPVRFRHPVTRAARTVAKNVLGGRTYPVLDFLDPVTTIVDVGANDGAFSVFAATNYPQATIHAFEPSQEAFHYLQHNSSLFRNIHPHNYGLYKHDASVPLYLGYESSVMNSVVAGRETVNATETINLRCAGNALKELGVMAPDIIKVDSEGCEVQVLESLAKMLQQVQVVYLEYHSEHDRRRIDNLLVDFALFKASAVMPHRGELCYVRRDILERNSHWNEFRIVVGDL